MKASPIGSKCQTLTSQQAPIPRPYRRALSHLWWVIYRKVTTNYRKRAALYRNKTWNNDDRNVFSITVVDLGNACYSYCQLISFASKCILYCKLLAYCMQCHVILGRDRRRLGCNKLHIIHLIHLIRKSSDLSLRDECDCNSFKRFQINKLSNRVA